MGKAPLRDPTAVLEPCDRTIASCSTACNSRQPRRYARRVRAPPSRSVARRASTLHGVFPRRCSSAGVPPPDVVACTTCRPAR